MKPKRRNPAAAALAGPLYRKRVEAVKTLYRRKVKHKGKGVYRWGPHGDEFDTPWAIALKRVNVKLEGAEACAKGFDTVYPTCKHPSPAGALDVLGGRWP